MGNPKGRLAAAAAVLCLIAASCAGERSTEVASDSPAEETTAPAPATTDRTIATSTSTSTTSSTSTTRKPVSAPTTPRAVVPPSTTTSAAPKPLTLIKAVVGVGPPCEGAGQSPDGCFWFVTFPKAQHDLVLSLHSDRGFRSTPGRTRPDQCDGSNVAGPNECTWYRGPVKDRNAGDRECWWLVTDTPGWSPRSNTVCFVWTARSTTTTGA